MLSVPVFGLFALVVFLWSANLHAQTILKKVPMGIQSSLLVIFFFVLFPAVARPQGGPDSKLLEAARKEKR